MWLIDVILIALLLINIVLCIKLKRSVNVIRNNRGYFARMLNEFNSAITQAKSSIEELKSLNNDSTASLKNYIAQAQETSEELACLKDVANNTIRRLEKLQPQDDNPEISNYSQASKANTSSGNINNNSTQNSNNEAIRAKTNLSRTERTKNNISDILDRLSSNNLSQSNDNYSRSDEEFKTDAANQDSQRLSRFNKLRRSS